MRVTIQQVSDDQFCIIDLHGTPICAVWFSSLDAAYEYCDKQGWETYGG